MNLTDNFSALFKSEKVAELVKKVKKDKKTLFIIGIGILGMLLIIIPSGAQENEDFNQDVKDIAYDCSYIENQVVTLIEGIKGAGKTRVLITYESDSESVYAVNTDEKSDGDSIQRKNDYIITDDERGLLLKVIYPRVRGVAVVCQGGNDPEVVGEIYSVISALFDISTNKISVAEMA